MKQKSWSQALRIVQILERTRNSISLFWLFFCCIMKFQGVTMLFFPEVISIKILLIPFLYSSMNQTPAYKLIHIVAGHLVPFSLNRILCTTISFSTFQYEYQRQGKKRVNAKFLFHFSLHHAHMNVT